MFVGEVGLGGEVRSVSQIEIRLKEAQRLGFKRAVIPKDNAKGIGKELGIERIEVCYLSEAVEIIG